MIGIIDIGSNTVRMNVYETFGDDFKLLFSVKEMAGLAAQIESNMLLEPGLQNLIRILNTFKQTIDIVGIKEVYPFATASLRLIHNQESALSRIKASTGFDVELLSGEEEGRLGVVGALSDINVPKAVLVDIGGGSCEVVPFEKDSVLESDSYALGSLSMYKQHVSGLLPTRLEQKEIKKHTKQIVEANFINDNQFVSVVGIGGTIRALLKLKQYLDKDYSDNNQLTLKRLKAMLEFLGNGTREAQDTILRVVPDRIHTLIPGLAILVAVLQELNCVEVLVSQNGVREGYLITHVLKS